MGEKLKIRYVWEVMLFSVTLQQMNEQLMETLILHFKIVQLTDLLFSKAVPGFEVSSFELIKLALDM